MDSFFVLLSRALDHAKVPQNMQQEIKVDLWRRVNKHYPHLVRERAIIDMRESGLTQRAIAQKLKISLRDVNQLCKKNNLARKR